MPNWWHAQVPQMTTHFNSQACWRATFCGLAQGSYVALARLLEGLKIDSNSVARIFPSVYFDFGYSF